MVHNITSAGDPECLGSHVKVRRVPEGGRTQTLTVAVIPESELRAEFFTD